MALAMELEKHLELMALVHDMVYFKEIKGQKVANDAKIFSIYERHTDIIMKGSREDGCSILCNYANKKIQGMFITL